MDRRAIPVFELSDYQTGQSGPEGIFVEPLETTMSRRPNRVFPHVHPFFQIFLLSGNGAAMLDFKEHTMSGVTLVLMSPGQVHTLRPPVRFTGTVVSFSQGFFDHTAPPPSRLFDFPFFFATGRAPVLPLPAEERPRFRDLFTELQREFDANQSGAAEVLRAHLQIIFTRAARLYVQGEPPSEAARPAQLVRQFRLAVENQFREVVSLAAYAKELKVTPNHLNDTVREQTGQPAGEIIRQRRLLEAKRLLLHSELSISEIGYHLNFADPSYFSRFFRRYHRQAPADFRTQIREKYQSNAV